MIAALAELLSASCAEADARVPADARGQDAQQWYDAASLAAPTDPYAPTPAEGVPTVRCPPAMWRVVGHERVRSYQPLDTYWTAVEGAPPALTPTRAAELWAAGDGDTGRATVQCDDGRVETVRIGAAVVYTATIVGAAS